MKETELKEQIKYILKTDEVTYTGAVGEHSFKFDKVKAIIDLIQQREAEAVRGLHGLLPKRIKHSNNIRLVRTGAYKLDTRNKRVSFKNGFNVCLGMIHKLLDRRAEGGQDE